MTWQQELAAITPVRQDEPLAKHTTYHIGGPADVYVVVKTAAELEACATIAYRHGVPLFILSGGSNLLVADKGIRGLVIDNRAQAITVARREDGRVRVEAEAGVPMATLARRMAKESLTGLEWAVGIPGTLGGVVVFNAGAHGATIADALEDVDLLRPDGATVTLPAAELGLGYRESIFTHAAEAGAPLGTILRVRLVLDPGERRIIEQRTTEYNDYRKATQPARASAGSVFKNPPGDSAGRLIEQAGLKGVRQGKAQISDVHANFIVNHGGATARDVLALLRRAQQAVHDQFGITLEPEIRIVGDWEGQP